MKLRTRFALFINILVLSILAIAAILIFIYQDNYLIRKTREYHINGLNQFTKACASSIHVKNRKEFLQYAYNIAYSTGMAYGAFYSTDGNIIFHSSSAVLMASLNPLYLESAVKSKNQVEFFDKEFQTSRPVQIRAKAVRDDKQVLGIAVLFYYPDVLKVRRSRALVNSMRRFVWVAVIALLTSLVLSYYLGLFLSKPIDVLVSGARAIAKGDLNHRIALRRSDEVGELADEFNTMAKKLQELDRLKEDFMANITHELRSPTTAIIGFSDMLLSGTGGDLSDKQEEWAETIKKSAQRLSGMINNILDIAKLEAGLMKFSPESVSVGEPVQEVIDLFQPIAAQQKINLCVQIQEGDYKAWVDPDSLQQVLINLVSNALKFTPDNGRVLVQIKTQKKYVMVSVSDTGPGIPGEAMPKLFTKFLQLHDKIKGTGLGLVICKGIIESQGGKIRATSEKGQGATFIFTLPAASS